jgi:hypothetical protein
MGKKPHRINHIAKSKEKTDEKNLFPDSFKYPDICTEKPQNVV